MRFLVLKQFLSPEEEGCYSTEKYCIRTCVSSFHSSDTQFLFEPKTQELFTCTYQSIITAEPITKSKFHKNSSIHFSAPLTNNSNEPVHRNQKIVLGLIQEIDKIQENEKSENIVSLQYVNLMRTSGDILKLRKSEFKINNLNLSHLSSRQKDAL